MDFVPFKGCSASIEKEENGEVKFTRSPCHMNRWSLINSKEKLLPGLLYNFRTTFGGDLEIGIANFRNFHYKIVPLRDTFDPQPTILPDQIFLQTFRLVSKANDNNSRLVVDERYDREVRNWLDYNCLTPITINSEISFAMGYGINNNNLCLYFITDYDTNTPSVYRFHTKIDASIADNLKNDIFMHLIITNEMNTIRFQPNTTFPTLANLCRGALPNNLVFENKYFEQNVMMPNYDSTFARCGIYFHKKNIIDIRKQY